MCGAPYKDTIVISQESTNRAVHYFTLVFSNEITVMHCIGWNLLDLLERARVTLTRGKGETKQHLKEVQEQ
jgi:cysteine sulfinate desulfinase/cysteine desulfurase-like protein